MFDYSFNWTSQMIMTSNQYSHFIATLQWILPKQRGSIDIEFILFACRPIAFLGCIGVEFFDFNLKFKNFNTVYGFQNPSDDGWAIHGSEP